ncbi:MAG: flagellar biosynthesis anti-sigma factor FlgM, partial [Dehalococcoidia bacterium]|nr:flagellar biosynthesis anti-sigma factor FlgM [Dehalococcoidia bacterium]
MTRIDGLNPLLTGRTAHGQGASGPEAAASSHTPEADAARRRQDNVALSDRGRLVAEASRAVAAAPEVRVHKVVELKAAIAAGTYSASSREIAARLLASGNFDGH